MVLPGTAKIQPLLAELAAGLQVTESFCFFWGGIFGSLLKRKSGD
jgi:hypothetical protein